MANNLSAIGFSFSNEAEFEAAMQKQVAEARDRVEAGPGQYDIWRSPTGAEVWFHVVERGGSFDVIGFTPFFEGRSSVPVHVTEAVQRDGDNDFEGAFYAWVRPPGLAPEDELEDGSPGSYPVLFEAVDFAAAAGHPRPFDAAARLAVFAQELSAYATAEAFLAAGTGGATLAPEALIPLGLITGALADNDNAGADAGGEDRSEEAEPTSAVLVTGKVLAHSLLTNESSGGLFHALSVKTFDATIDVVADPDVVAGEIVVGGTVEVTGLLFGRIVSAA